jgi:hypothetical protein
MLKTFDETAALISEGKLLHISGSAGLLSRLPRGRWIGGSAEYFMDEDGGQISDSAFGVRELNFDAYKIVSYDSRSLPRITKDAYPNGFSIVIMPFESEVYGSYAQHAAEYEGIFLKNIVGWVSGRNLDKPEQLPGTVNGDTGEASSEKAVALHIGLPEDKTARVAIMNIFSPDKESPIITFPRDGFHVETCLINGKETVLADHITANGLDTRLPLVGDYAGANVNISIKEIKDGTVDFYAPLFRGIEYRFAESIPNYADAFNAKIKELELANVKFACNCIINFTHGKLENKKLDGLYGPFTFGEVAWGVFNQTLVYLCVE